MEFCITKLRQFHVLANFGILSRTQFNVVVQTSRPVQQCRTFQCHQSPGNWRPIIREVSSSLENVSQKGAKFEEDLRTYSSKASRIVLPTFGILDDRDGDLVSSSVGSLEQCLHMINTSLCSWLPESRNFLSEFAKNIKERETIYWVQGLCPNHAKSLALGERGLAGLDRAKCPSANFGDRVFKPVAKSLRAKKVYCVIFRMNAFGTTRIACAPRMKRRNGWLKLLVSSPISLTEKKPNTSSRTAAENLSRQ